MDQYQVGARALFQDENQCEIRGVICYRADKGDFLLLRIRQDDGSIYWAKLFKRDIPEQVNQ